MEKVLGLDLGTNSIGWAVIEKEKDEETRLIDKGVLIFTEGVKSEKGIESSRASARTEKRSARRLKFRRKLRKYETLLVLSKNNMCPLKVEEVIAWRKSGFKQYPTNSDFINWLKTDDNKNLNPYHFRDKASRGALGKLELGRAFYHIAQRRGFWSNRLDKSDEGIIEQHKPELEVIINDAKNKIEILQEIERYFIQLDIIDSESKKLKRSKDLDAGENKLRTLYNFFNHKDFKKNEISTIELKKIFLKKLDDKGNLGVVKGAISQLTDKIKAEGCTTLGQYFWKLYQRNRGVLENKIRNNYTDREKHYLHEFKIICKQQDLDTTLANDLEKAIFYQRPLKSQKGLVGKCSLEKNKPRCSISHPDFEEFRKLQFINSIKVLDTNGQKQFLNEEQKENISDLFLRKSKPHFDFSDVSKKLNIVGNRFNYDSKTVVSGCPTSSSLKNIFGKEWKEKVFKRDFLNKNGKKISYNYKDLWHVLFTFDTDIKLQDFALNKLKLSNNEAVKFSKVSLKKDYTSLSLKAINKILPYLREGLLYSHAVFMANMQNVIIADRWKNKEDRELIQESIREIIEHHQLENKNLFVINSLLKNCKDAKESYSKEAENIFRKDLIKMFNKEFGEKTFANRNDKESIVSNSFEKFIRCLKSNKKEEQFLSIKRIDEKIIDFLDDNNLLRDKEKIFHPSDLESFKSIVNKKGLTILGNPVTGSIKNPMAMRAMYQLRKIVNSLIEEGVIDAFTKINIELARELNDANKRKAIKKWQDDRNKKKEDYRKKVEELFVADCGKEIKPTDDDILKYELWIEQNNQCLYTEGEKNTIAIRDVVGDGATCELEHTIPRSISYDSTMTNLTLSHKRANNLKGNKMPFEIGEGGNGLGSHEVILMRIAHWKKEYEELEVKINQKLRATKAATTKEQKDRLIQQRHYLKMDYDYWKGKYERFIIDEVPSGFARRQLTDIGIITKYARAYLKSVFPKVYSVKGTMVDQFRKAWGLHDKDNDGNYIAKDRGNHTHHCKDAITIACMDKYKYDKMAEAWRSIEKGDKQQARNIIAKTKPWKNFAEDIRNIENEILVVHHTKNVVPIQTKKKVRKRGKIQYGKDDKPMYEKGDTIRGSLHKDTFYGAIAKKDEKGNILKSKEDKVIPTYVERVKLTSLKKAQVEKIVDDNVKEIIEKSIITNVLKFGKSNNTIAEEGIWMNKEKLIPINKVRVHVRLKSPLHIKEQRDKKEGKEYKHQYLAANDENYCMAIYEGVDQRGKIKRAFELVNNMDAADYFKLSNKNHRSIYPITPEIKNNLNYKAILTKGKLVLFYKENKNELWSLDTIALKKRLYKVIAFEGDGRIQFRHHQIAMQQSSSNEKEMTIIKYMKMNKISNSRVNYENPVPWLRISSTAWNFIIEGFDFIINPLGKMHKI